MELAPEIIRQLHETFAVEFEEQLQIITDGCLSFEKGIRNKAGREDTLQEIFRAAHNIKGAARGLDLQDISTISHHLETCFSVLKHNSGRPDAAFIDLCLEAIDRMRESMQSTRTEQPPGFDVDELAARLELAATEAKSRAVKAAPAKKAARAAGRKATKKSKKTARKKTARATGKTTTGRTQKAPEKSLPDKPEPPDSAASQSLAVADSGGRIGGEVIRVAMDKIQEVTNLSEELQVAKVGTEEHFAAIHKLQERIDHLARKWRDSQRSFRHRSPADQLPDEIRSLFVNSADEIAELNELVSRSTRVARSTMNRLGYVTSALQNNTRNLRLVPVANVLRPLVRSVRDMGRDMKKEVDIEIMGDDIEIDRSILEQLRDPLMHLLRNAVDHGIEAPQERKLAGKPASGQITIQVDKEGSVAVIHFMDDGAGIDPGMVLQQAVEKKLITSNEGHHLSHAAQLDLIFRPGLSTKRIITNISGRGVGLDVVRANLKAIKGSVVVSSSPGEGCAFTLRVPLTMMTEKGLVVRCNGASYIVPTTSIERILEISIDDVIEVEASQAVMLDERPVPLRSLATLLEKESQRATGKDHLTIVVVSKGWDAVALLVDDVIGEREFIVKRLQPPLMSVRNVGGATYMGDGSLIVVLNPLDLVDSSRQSGKGGPAISGLEAREEIVPPHILVVDDSITTRTLERNILENLGYRVSVAVDGREGWESLQAGEFDLIITDIEMPVMNGFELTERIKSSGQYGSIPVIIVTSLAKEADRRRGIEVGADAYIVKGEFETRALMDVVRQLV